jgi:hypothetical protein
MTSKVEIMYNNAIGNLFCVISLNMKLAVIALIGFFIPFVCISPPKVSLALS